MLSEHNHLEMIQAATYYLCVTSIGPAGTPYCISPSFKRAMAHAYQYPLVKVAETVMLNSSVSVSEDDGCVYVCVCEQVKFW